jgi:hypothetical protein
MLGALVQVIDPSHKEHGQKGSVQTLWKDAAVVHFGPQDEVVGYFQLALISNTTPEERVEQARLKSIETSMRVIKTGEKPTAQTFPQWIEEEPERVMLGEDPAESDAIQTGVIKLSCQHNNISDCNGAGCPGPDAETLAEEQRLNATKSVFYLVDDEVKIIDSSHKLYGVLGGKIQAVTPDGEFDLMFPLPPHDEKPFRVKKEQISFADVDPHDDTRD